MPARGRWCGGCRRSTRRSERGNGQLTRRWRGTSRSIPGRFAATLSSCGGSHRQYCYQNVIKWVESTRIAAMIKTAPRRRQQPAPSIPRGATNAAGRVTQVVGKRQVRRGFVDQVQKEMPAMTRPNTSEKVDDRHFRLEYRAGRCVICRPSFKARECHASRAPHYYRSPVNRG
jgi:hypothetical protein